VDNFAAAFIVAMEVVAFLVIRFRLAAAAKKDPYNVLTLQKYSFSSTSGPTTLESHYREIIDEENEVFSVCPGILGGILLALGPFMIPSTVVVMVVATSAYYENIIFAGCFVLFGLLYMFWSRGYLLKIIPNWGPRWLWDSTIQIRTEKQFLLQFGTN